MNNISKTAHRGVALLASMAMAAAALSVPARAQETSQSSVELQVDDEASVCRSKLDDGTTALVAIKKVGAMIVVHNAEIYDGASYDKKQPVELGPRDTLFISHGALLLKMPRAPLKMAWIPGNYADALENAEQIKKLPLLIPGLYKDCLEGKRTSGQRAEWQDVSPHARFG